MGSISVDARGWAHWAVSRSDALNAGTNTLSLTILILFSLSAKWISDVSG